jgi:hypothetical protein
VCAALRREQWWEEEADSPDLEKAVPVQRLALILTHLEEMSKSDTTDGSHRR